MPRTTRQKKLLIERFKTMSDEKLESLIRTSNTVCNTYDSRINRKVNSVNVTLWNVKIKDVLEVERRKALSMKTLLDDVKSMNVGN
ncbi:hypothetical protein PSN45_002225 [Yamadazyma tenuis]|uniref:Uncharacterized protein n=1 Tax=Candida tenuis (strain ATCC 10573 / BCRC 21748 / CBS 615 / JCM 9827 / NBRC 10315 / NRRL Y-1498 / VKM Y-70) TaxID=590646 RepID=G3BFL0_CANTC|nr:uncharacterized protein CANTEDRAFT_116070 [Yamadazyma tenuis ATCC 10573]XP_006690212.1 uncharacterized protein CANTEDRAFT_116070 [Yamadazyma tenuis ATCC 10573]EGV60997.1 hypothetical protein CANTEDRAFT_116070 [Yamadazyma tenuis ATCC 10573]EGV60998.1 hypothetical protein CANTEDRAFT_116070 [Yamadazyma tenuis ATCC 10573]WEJ94731.1 hypothetical protein PSN45_002225 [Yamadazyma tenuis]